MKTAVFTAATKSYAYALGECALHLARCLRKSNDEFLWIIATDKKETVLPAASLWESFGFSPAKIIETGIEEKSKKYKEASQLSIATLQQACMDEAVKWDADLYFSVESDVLIHPGSYEGLKWVLEFPVKPGYGIAAATYFNGSFLCGRGTPQRHICEDFLEGERVIPKKLSEELAKTKKLIQGSRGKDEEAAKKLSELSEEIKKCAPKGNVFAMNAKQWRRRGWLDAAYPGAACQGSLLPTDWCGLGCTMWGRDVMNVTDFTGYDGRGTQDLFLVWSKWHPAGKKIGCLVGAPAGHVKMEDGKRILWEPFFVPEPEEAAGHIRVRKKPFPQVELVAQKNS